MIARKYATYARICLQEALVYRANAVVWMLVDSLPACTMLLIWTAVYRGQGVIAGYRLGDMIAYYLAATFLGVAITPHMEYLLSYEIRQGTVSGQLVRPWSYFWAVVGNETTWQVVKGSVSLPLFLLLGWAFRAHLTWPRLGPSAWGVVLLSVVLAYLINVGAKMALGALAFWVVEPLGIAGIYGSLAWFLQGGVVPIDMFPPWLQGLSRLLPFRYTLAFPVQLLLGRLPEGEVWSGVLVQFGWACALLAVAGLVWRRGVRAYTAVGG